MYNIKVKQSSKKNFIKSKISLFCVFFVLVGIMIPNTFAFGAPLSNTNVDVDQYAWYNGNSGNTTNPVGQNSPNPFGISDVYGNVWQWVEDCWHDNYNGAPSNGTAFISANCPTRVMRGGSFGTHPYITRSANRYGDNDFRRSAVLGFRVARTIDP